MKADRCGNFSDRQRRRQQQMNALPQANTDNILVRRTILRALKQSNKRFELHKSLHLYEVK